MKAQLVVHSKKSSPRLRVSVVTGLGSQKTRTQRDIPQSRLINAASLLTETYLNH